MYKWSIGSRPGYDDIYPYTDSQLECSQVVEADMSELQEGHVYYVSVLVRSNALYFSLIMIILFLFCFEIFFKTIIAILYLLTLYY